MNKAQGSGRKVNEKQAPCPTPLRQPVVMNIFTTGQSLIYTVLLFDNRVDFFYSPTPECSAREVVEGGPSSKI
jgi:hypothetical protein